TFFASILTGDDIDRLAKTHVPRLGSKGAVWGAGLEMVSQGLTIAELERELGQRFPEVLTSAHKASEFVGHLVATAEAGNGFAICRSWWHGPPRSYGNRRARRSSAPSSSTRSTAGCY